MARSLKSQAFRLLKSRSPIGDRTKPIKIVGNYKPIKSMRSLKDSSLALAKIADALNVKRLKDIKRVDAEQYLIDKQQNFASQKALDRDRKALAIALNIKIPRLKSMSRVELKGRSYSKVEIDAVIKFMSPRNAFSAYLAYQTGLRAHELLSINRVGELSKSETRKWSEQRFLGQEGSVVFVVKGKGGLQREVAVPKNLAEQLESYRLEKPRIIKDRGVIYTTKYDLAGGNNLSAAFTRASKRALGYSHGLHGLRHSYTQERIDYIKREFGLSHYQARDIVAEELGHFRGDITEVYLR